MLTTKRFLSLTAAALALTVSGCTLNRADDPVVLTGADVPALSSVAAQDVVAFRYIDGWGQLPVQVDERKPVNFTQVYNNAQSVNFTTTAYADPGTFTGADANPNVDADDEIAFMARDTGLEAPSDAGVPAGVVAGSGVKLRVRTTLGGKTRDGWVYLFKRSGNLSPGAGKKYVDYTFHLNSGDYKTTYKLAAGPNPEDSSVTTPYYSTHFSDRWLRDELKVTAGDATGVDILDRAKARLAPGTCGRSEDTFDAGEGAFVTNKSGPVRAIRSYIGANSGPLTQREHIFYDRREDVRTFLRVHAVPGPLDYFDYSDAAIGMTYKNTNNTGGVTIDGTPDTVTAGPLSWETVDGAQGGLSMAHSIDTDIAGLATTSYYLDNSTPATTGPETQCTGDGRAIGASGPWSSAAAIPNTDPRTAGASKLNSFRTIYFEAPGKADGPARSAEAASPFQFSASPLP
jgi:hypothetical protein